MPSINQNSDFVVKLISEQIPYWESQIHLQNKVIAKSEAERARLLEMIETGKKLAELAGVAIPSSSRNLSPRTRARLAEARGRREGTWMTEIMRLLADEDRGAAYDDLKARIELGEFGERLKHSDKGLYGGVAKLEAAGELVKYNGRLFTASAFQAFQSRLAEGGIEDITESEKARPSPMADAILAYVSAHGPAASREIVEHLRGMKEFETVVTKNKTSVYNVISRLFNRGQLSKGDGFYSTMKGSLLTTQSNRE